jgi:hypothetical protein
MTDSPFKTLQDEAKGKRGRGMKKPPKPTQAGTNTKLPEHTPAVAVKAPARSYRIGNYISEDAGEKLEDICIKLRRKEGRKIKIAEALERAIESLYKEITE